jgi:hypothetical protein
LIVVGDLSLHSRNVRDRDDFVPFGDVARNGLAKMIGFTAGELT